MSTSLGLQTCHRVSSSITRSPHVGRHHRKRPSIIKHRSSLKNTCAPCACRQPVHQELLIWHLHRPTSSTRSTTAGRGGRLLPFGCTYGPVDQMYQMCLFGRNLCSGGCAGGCAYALRGCGVRVLLVLRLLRVSSGERAVALCRVAAYCLRFNL